MVDAASRQSTTALKAVSSAGFRLSRKRSFTRVLRPGSSWADCGKAGSRKRNRRADLRKGRAHIERSRLIFPRASTTATNRMLAAYDGGRAMLLLRSGSCVPKAALSSVTLLKIRNVIRVAHVPNKIVDPAGKMLTGLQMPSGVSVALIFGGIEREVDHRA